MWLGPVWIRLDLPAAFESDSNDTKWQVRLIERVYAGNWISLG
jgi:hypothetical protein